MKYLQLRRDVDALGRGGGRICRALLVCCLVMLWNSGCRTTPPPPRPSTNWMARSYLGDAHSQAMLALAYIRADGGYPTDYTLGYVWAQQSAARNHPLGLYCLGRLHFYGLGAAPERDKGIELFLKAQPGLDLLAKEGDPEALCALALLCSLPEPDVRLPRDEHKALGLLTRASANDYPPAMTSLGTLLLFGGDDIRNEFRGMGLIERAAEQGYAPAECVLGLIKTLGDKRDRDAEEGVGWLRRAAEKGLRDAQFYLAIHLENGWGTPADPAEAAKWFAAANVQSSPGGSPAGAMERNLSGIESRGGFR